MTNVAIFATAAGQSDLQFTSIVIPASGRYTITHDVAFDPDGVSILGVAERPSPGYDLIHFTNATFAAAAEGIFYRDLFPNDAGYPRHGELIDALLDENAAVVMGFLGQSGAAASFFHPTGSFRIIQYTAGVPIGGTIPIPAGIFLLGPLVGAGAIAAAARRRRTA